MALQQAVGTAFAVVSAVPSAITSAGFTALSGWQQVGRLSEIPSLTGEFDIATFDDLTTGEEVKFSDINRAGDGEIKLGLDLNDAGQIIVETAALTGAALSMRFTLTGGTSAPVYYRRGIIKSYMPTDITTGNVVMATVMIAFFGKSIKKT